MDVTLYSDVSTWEVSSYSCREDTLALTLVAVIAVLDTTELSGEVSDAFADLLRATTRSVVMGCACAVKMV